MTLLKAKGEEVSGVKEPYKSERVGGVKRNAWPAIPDNISCEGINAGWLQLSRRETGCFSDLPRISVSSRLVHKDHARTLPQLAATRNWVRDELK